MISQTIATSPLREAGKSDKGEQLYYLAKVTIGEATLPDSYSDRDIKKDSERYYIDTTRYKTEEAFKKALAKAGTAEDAYITVDLTKVEGAKMSPLANQ